MKKSIVWKGLVLGIIILFIGASVVSSNVSLKEDKSVLLLDNQDDGVILNNWWNANWSYRKQITINHTVIDDDLANFPALIHNISSDFPNHAQPDGDDFIFINASGTKLNHEIEKYDNSSGEITAWVNITLLSSTNDTILWLYYGNPNCTNQENVEDVWDSDFVVVHHLQEISGVHFDSTSNNWDGNPSGVTQNSSGMIDGADWFDGSNDFMDRPGSSGLEYNSMTIGAWVKKDSQPTGERVAVGKHQSGVKAGYFLEAYNTKFAFYVGCPSPPRRIITPEDYDLLWHYVVGVYDNGDMELYVDGSLKASGTVSGMTHTSVNVNIGRIYTAGYWHGGIDEVRISNNIRNASWISTEYKNQNDSESFIDVGGQEPYNYPPIANFTYTPTNPIQTDIIQFNDTSVDPDGTIVSWLWDFGDTNTSTLQNPTHQYSDFGNYTVTLNVTDDFGATNETSQIIVVANSVPIANFTYSPPNPTKNETIYFTDTSTDIDGTIVDWLWDFDDGYSSSLQNPTHQYSDDGTYNVTLTVTDDDGASDTIMQTIVVYTPPNTPPYTPDNPIPEDNATNVPIDITLSWTGGDPDPGDTTTYDVYFGSMPPLPKVSSNQSATSYETGTLSYQLTYYWKIIAWDNHGASAEGPTWHFTTEEAPLPDLNCYGTLSWVNVNPGASVIGYFTVENIGELGSLLDWEIDNYPDWGIWMFTPSSGDDLKPEDGPVTVGVTVIAPNQQNEEFTGNVTIVNKENSSDFCTIDVSLATPVNQPSPQSQSINIHSFIKRLML